MGALTIFGGKNKNKDSDTGIHYRRMSPLSRRRRTYRRLRDQDGLYSIS